MLLSFKVSNYRCFRENAALTLVNSGLKTNVPRGGKTWKDHVEPVAAVYGPNASGKTTLLDAIWSVATAVRNPGARSLRHPSLPRVEGEATDYEVEFVYCQTRYEYQVTHAGWGISRETLYSYPKGARRLLFDRSQEAEKTTATLEKGPSLAGPTAQVWKITQKSALFLATALKYGHRSLAPVARGLVSDIGINYVTFRNKQDNGLVERMILEILNNQTDEGPLVKGLLRAADLGISDTEVRKEKISPEVRDRLQRMLTIMHEGEEEESEVDVPELADVLEFKHRGPDGQPFTLPLARESAGTLTWMTISWHALNALRKGTVLLIDELDASLHPDLARYVVEIFMNPLINTRGAQLIFTTHDVTLLNNAPTRLLRPSQVWFVEKDSSGAAELFSLSDFDTRQGNNAARQYLAGRFGATPEIDENIVLQHVGGNDGR